MKYTVTYRYDEAKEECVATATIDTGVAIALETSPHSFTDAKTRLIETLKRVKKSKNPPKVPPAEEIEV